jgi:hypothetical protein
LLLAWKAPGVVEPAEHEAAKKKLDFGGGTRCCSCVRASLGYAPSPSIIEGTEKIQEEWNTQEGQECRIGGLQLGAPTRSMSVYLWNCRGLGNDATVRELRDFTRECAPSVLCVVETQIHKSRVEILASTLGYDNAFDVSSQGRSGGIGIFWNNEIKIDVLPYSQYHIDAVVTLNDMDPWRLTCVYGEAKAYDRHKTWDMLKFIKASSPLP